MPNMYELFVGKAKINGQFKYLFRIRNGDGMVKGSGYTIPELKKEMTRKVRRGNGLDMKLDEGSIKRYFKDWVDYIMLPNIIALNRDEKKELYS